MKNCRFVLVVVALTAVALLIVWRPELASRFVALLCSWQGLLSLLIVVVAALLLACGWPRSGSGRAGGETSAEDGDETLLEPPYPAPPTWKSISEFKYESDLKLTRHREGIPDRRREAQYVVAEAYTVSFNLDGRRRTVTVPKGMLTDLASVPRFLRFLVGRVGPHLEAAIVHDYQYIAWQVNKIPPTKHMRRFADALMLAAMNAAGLRCRAWGIYCAVRLFGCPTFFRESGSQLVLDEWQVARQ